jgi:SAM-dependent methyltransferase
MNIKDQWDALYSQKRYRPVYPHDRVVAWTFRNFPKDSLPNCKLLDIGCGAGRHAIFWASEGYSAFACDFSSVAIEEAKKSVDQNGLNVGACQCEADDLPYNDNEYDGVLCYGVLYYLPYERFCKAVKEIHRVLKPGGKAFIVTRTVDDSRAVQAQKLDANTYRLKDLDSTAPSDAESGMLMTMLSLQGVTNVFSDFSGINIDRCTISSNNGKFIDDDWYVNVVK